MNSNYLQDTSKCSCTYKTDSTKGRQRQMTILLMETCTKKMACGLALTALFNSTATHFYGNRCMGLYIYPKLLSKIFKISTKYMYLLR